MERLTYKVQGNCGFVRVARCHRASMQDVIDRLAAYEDTGLEPEDIEALRDREQGLAELLVNISCGCAVSYTRLADLAQAEKDGRLVVLPHGRWIPFHSDIAGDIQYCSVCEIGFEEMTDFCPHCGAKMDLPEAALKMREDDDD